MYVVCGGGLFIHLCRGVFKKDVSRWHSGDRVTSLGRGNRAVRPILRQLPPNILGGCEKRYRTSAAVTCPLSYIWTRPLLRTKQQSCLLTYMFDSWLLLTRWWTFEFRDGESMIHSWWSRILVFFVIKTWCTVQRDNFYILMRNGNGKGKSTPFQAWTDPECYRTLRLSDFKTIGKVVSPTHRPPLPPGNIPGTHFC